jgi:ABC-type cobalamin transport system permease subunit
MRFAFRSRRRIFAFIIIYAVLYIQVGKGLQAGGPDWWFWPIVAFAVATVYAILISQFRRRDIAILKCVSWSNPDVTLLLIGEAIVVAISAFLVVFQLTVEILGVAYYFFGGTAMVNWLQAYISLQAAPMVITLFLIVVLQIPGLVLAQFRANHIPPMMAIREE